MRAVCMHEPYKLIPREDGKPDAAGFEAARALAGGLTREEMEDLAKAARADYLWKWREDGALVGMCSHCERAWALGKTKTGRAGSIYRCPHCWKEIIVKDLGRGRKSLLEELYILDWRQIDEHTLGAVGAEVRWDCRAAAIEDMEMTIYPSCLAIYRYGKGVEVYKRRRWEYGSTDGGEHYKVIEGTWRRVKDFTALRSYGMSARAIYMKPESEGIMAAMTGTRFGAVWEGVRRAHHGDEREKLPMPDEWSLRKMAMYPCIEYLGKMGQGKLAKVMLYHETDARQAVIKPKGKRAQDVLGLDGQQLGEVRRKGTALTGPMLWTNKLAAENGVRMAMETLSGIGWMVEDIQKAREKIRRMPERMRKKAANYVAQKLPRGLNSLRDLLDYWGQLSTLEADMGDEMMVLPKDLGAAHAAATEKIRCQKDAGLDKLIGKRLGRLRKGYEFAWGGLVLAPLEDTGAVIREGEKLRHCVGRYAESYAKGRTVLCSLRREEEPEEPWRTVEFSARDGHLAQDRGYRNNGGGMDEGERELIKAFWDAFEQWRIGNGRKTA